MNRWTKKLWIWLGTMVNDISLAHINYRSVEQNKTPDIFCITLLCRSNHSCKSKCSQTATDLGAPDFKCPVGSILVLVDLQTTFFWDPNPRMSQNRASEHKTSGRNNQFLKVVFLQHSLSLVSYGCYVLRKGDSFLLCQRLRTHGHDCLLCHRPLCDLQ